MDRLKLKWKLFAMLLLFCAILLVILWLFQTVFLDMFYRDIRVRQVRQAAEVISENLGDPDFDIGEFSRERDIVAELAGLGNSGRNREIVGRLLSQSYGYEFYEYTDAPQMQPRRGFMGNIPPMRSLVYAKRVENAETQPLVIIIRAVISPVNATVTTLRYQLYIISGIMLVLSVTLAIIMAKRVSKPIEDINASAAKLATGDYDVRFSGRGFAEIVSLSDTLNTAAVELGKVEGLRRELMANVSHDLRTPLALIYSYAEMMRDFPGEITPEQPETIMGEAKRLTSLVNDVLDVSKLESGIESLNLSSFCITLRVEDAVNRMNELLVNEGFEISFEYDSEIRVEADEAKIDRAFYNLLTNAVNYTGESKKVYVKQSVRENSVRISVTDGGDGIPTEELPLIWDRYYKSSSPHKRGVMGTGLGLSIVKKIVELHGGSCGVESELGHGSTFWFEIKI